MRRLITLLVAGGLAAAACGPGGEQTQQAGPRHGDKLTVALGIDPDTLDPAAQTTTTASQVVDMMAETLVTIDEKGETKPLLATQWQQAADGLSYTFTLRSGVKFSDGTPFNAQAVKFSIERLLSPSTFKPQPGVLRAIDKVEVVDDLHVRFTLKSKMAPFVAAMTQTVAAMISPASVNAAPNKPEQISQPVGTGPYKFKDRMAGDHITLEINNDYWGRKANYETQALKIVPDAATREALVKSSGADVIMLPPANDIPALQNDRNVKVIMGPSDRTIQIIFNHRTGNPLLQKKEVRQALNYAVDKDAIIKTALFGAAVPLEGPMSKTLFGNCSVGSSYKYDANKARQLLQQAGASGLSVKMLTPTGRYLQDRQVAEAVAGYLREVGIKVDGPGTMDWPTYLGTVNVAPEKASTDLHLLGWAPPYLDAQQQFLQFQSSQWPPAGLATSYYKNPEVESLVDKANGGTDPEQRKKDYCQASKIVWDDAPWIFLYNQRFPLVTTAKVSGVYGVPNEKFVTTWASPA